ncbi:hypothetical protein JW766_00530 [Candidatus Dojkabacteria bacterium]|nr:hypothetical protein [Candidatus Dojkabacteria bacterium]
METIDQTTEQAILAQWQGEKQQSLSEARDYQTVSGWLDILSSPEFDDRHETIPNPIPGLSTFTDPIVIYVVYKHEFSEERAIKAYQHEQEHSAVYDKYNVPYKFGIILANDNGNLMFIAMVIPTFQHKMPVEQRQAIMREVNEAVSEPSLRDRKALT